MSDADSVFCPKCNVGFAPDTPVCPICKIPLTSQDEYEDDLDEIPKPVIINDELPSLKELRTAGVDWIHHLQDKLAEVGIPHRIEQSHPPRMLFSIYVRPEDLPAAKDIDEKVFAAEVPDSQGMPHLEDLDFSSCPGCGSPMGVNDLKCSSCGLDLSPTVHWRCSHCDKLIEINVAACPHCGYDIDSSIG